VHVAAGQVCQLRDPQAGLHVQHDQRVVASADPGHTVRCGEQGVTLVRAEEADDAAGGAFAGDGKDTLDRRGVLGAIRAAWRNSEWIAASRAFLVVALLPRSVSGC
jgi:hypothetical protein